MGRRLAAILEAEAVGYSLVMAKDVSVSRQIHVTHVE
jgi:hypothetical protein